MIKIGTAHFVTEADARRYYKPLGHSIVDVREALEAGTIHLGPPTLGPNQTLSIEQGRYFIGVENGHQQGEAAADWSICDDAV